MSPPRRAEPRPPSRRELIGQVIDGKYEVLGMLGEGGMGAVLEAEHRAIGRVVAIKVLHAAQAAKSTAVKRFHQEARAAGGIGHPNICEVFDFGSLADGSPYLVMERLKGRTLAERIEREKELPFGDVADTMIQVLSGLGAAHERGILHRDIKPENVFLAERAGYPPIVKILDFGVSKVVHHARDNEWDDETDLTKTGMVMGTPYYMSPEQARGDRNLDARVDIYACGVVLYEALSGKRPFTASNYNTLLAMILQGTYKPLHDLRPSIPADFEELVRKAMAKRREQRFQTAEELVRALGPIRKRMATTSAQRVAPPPRRTAHVSSADIPIHFSDSDSSDVITSPEIEPPSPFDDESAQDATIRIDSPLEDKDKTDRMQQDDVKLLTDAIRQAREAEKRRQR